MLSIIGTLIIFMQTWTGISYYAGMAPEFPVRKALDCFPARLERPAIALVWGSFGDSTRLIRGFIEKYKDREHLIEIHISNECARRSGRAVEGKILLPHNDHETYTNSLANRGAKTAIRKRLDEIDMALSPILTPNTHIWYSSGLEIAVTSRRALTNLHQMIGRWIAQKGDPRIKTVFNPMKYGDELYGADLRESHGSDFNGDIFNLDGVSLDFGHKFFQTINKETFLLAISTLRTKPKAIFLWNADHQGLRGTTSWIHKKGYADREYIFTKEVCSGFKSTLKELEAINGK